MISGQATQIIIGIFVALTWLSMIMRIYLRVRYVRKLFVDDWAMLVTAVAYSGFCGMAIWTIFYIVPAFDDPPDLTALPLAMKLLFADLNIFIVCTALLKISFTLFLLRFVVVRWQRLVLMFSTGIFLQVGSAYFLFTLFSCGLPQNHYQTMVDGKCLDRHRISTPVSYAYSGVNLVSDLIFTIIAIFWYRGARHDMSRTERIVVKVFVVIGILGSSCSFLPIYFLRLLDQDVNNIRKYVYDIGILTALKIGMTVMVTSLEALEPMFFEAPTKETLDQLDRKAQIHISHSSIDSEEEFETLQVRAAVAQARRHPLRWSRMMDVAPPLVPTVPLPPMPPIAHGGGRRQTYQFPPPLSPLPLQPVFGGKSRMMSAYDQESLAPMSPLFPGGRRGHSTMQRHRNSPPFAYHPLEPPRPIPAARNRASSVYSTDVRGNMYSASSHAKRYTPSWGGWI